MNESPVHDHKKGVEAARKVLLETAYIGDLSQNIEAAIAAYFAATDTVAIPRDGGWFFMMGGNVMKSNLGTDRRGREIRRGRIGDMAALDVYNKLVAEVDLRALSVGVPVRYSEAEHRIATLEREIGAVRVAFRVNMLRLNPGISHAEIDAEIERVSRL